MKVLQKFRIMMATLFAFAVASPVFAQNNDFTYTITVDEVKWASRGGTELTEGVLYSTNKEWKTTKIKHVIIEKGITSISSNVFRANPFDWTPWRNLESIDIPDTVTSIDLSAFSNSSLVSINVAKGNPAYYSKDGVLFDKETKTLIKCPEGKTETKYTIPNGIENIGEDAFINSHIQNVKIPKSVKSIGEYAFAYSDLQSVNIPNSVTSIGKYALAYSGLQSIEIPKSVTDIRECVFAYCKSLQSTKISNNVIGHYEFYGCSSLKNVVIPKNVITIGKGAFECSGNPSIVFEDPYGWNQYSDHWYWVRASEYDLDLSVPGKNAEILSEDNSRYYILKCNKETSYEFDELYEKTFMCLYSDTYIYPPYESEY